ncbi:MAG: Bax inhibitor-1 family protein [Coriobacteriales bacterium]|nr:Bax inhibitor-1 family protein [Coriobacteriales bacterium]
MSRYENSLSTQQSVPTISRRAYNLLTYGLVTVSFLITWGMYGFVNGGGLSRALGGVNPLLLLVAYLAGTIGGFVLMGIGKSKQSVAVSLVGYAIFTATFGGTLALLLTRYNVGTIYYAFAITACISGIFLILGVMFPEFFAAIGRILFASLLAIIVVELVATIFFHADQTIFDYIVVLLFCGFLGYDSYLMSSDAPTVPNSIFYASEIYIDIVNILVRVLDIMDNK